MKLALGLAFGALALGLACGGAIGAPAAKPTDTQTQAAPTATQTQQAQPNDQLGPSQTGQPGAECGEENAPNTPGNSALSFGSPFNEDGIAGLFYAGEQPQNSKNTASVSQYDTACAHAKSK